MVLAQFAQSRVFVCVEDWLDPGIPAPEKPGFKTLRFPRPVTAASCGYATRGGITVYFHKSLQSGGSRVSVWRRHSSGCYFWIIFEGVAESTTTLMLAACYFPPISSSLSSVRRAHAVRVSEDAWEDLQADCAEAEAVGEVLIAGDLNARTGSLQGTRSLSVSSAGGSEDPSADLDGLELDLGGVRSLPPVRASQDITAPSVAGRRVHAL